MVEINKVTPLYQNVSPSKDNWIGGGSGMSSVGYNSVATSSYIRIELYINSGDKSNNKVIFDALYAKKDKIELEFGEPLTWERLDDNVTARIKFEMNNVSIFNEVDWKKMIDAFQEVDLEGIPNLKGPTEKRFYDGAAIANIKVTYKGRTYETNGFDHGNPPVEIEKLVNCITLLAIPEK